MRAITVKAEHLRIGDVLVGGGEVTRTDTVDENTYAEIDWSYILGYANEAPVRIRPRRRPAHVPLDDADLIEHAIAELHRWHDVGDWHPCPECGFDADGGLRPCDADLADFITDLIDLADEAKAEAMAEERLLQGEF